MAISPLPSLRQLTYLVALHEHGHFSRAATACFVTQSTLSVGIAELERVLGTLLVERSKRSVRFTPVGELVVARALALIRATEDLCAVARGAREPLVGPVRLAVIPTIAPYLLPRILAGLRDAYPKLNLIVRELLTGAACEALHRGAGDCVLLALPADCGDIDSYEIAVDPLLLATAATGPAPDTVVEAAAIDPDRLLLLEDGHCLREHALTACRTAGPSDAPLVASTLETLVRLVDAGLGITLLPQLSVTAGILDHVAVRSQAFAAGTAERRIALAWRRDHSRESEFRLLGRAIRDIVHAGDAAATAREPADAAI